MDISFDCTGGKLFIWLWIIVNFDFLKGWGSIWVKRVVFSSIVFLLDGSS